MAIARPRRSSVSGPSRNPASPPPRSIISARPLETSTREGMPTGLRRRRAGCSFFPLSLSPLLSSLSHICLFFAVSSCASFFLTHTHSFPPLSKLSFVCRVRPVLILPRFFICPRVSFLFTSHTRLPTARVVYLVSLQPRFLAAIYNNNSPLILIPLCPSRARPLCLLLCYFV